MDPYQNNTSGYNRIPEDGGTASKTESWALIEAARKIAESITAGDEKDKNTKEARRDALRLNWHLWTIFQAELTTADESFPNDIRINILTLCQFIDKHTVACLNEPKAEKMRVLIDINRNIAAGLATMPENEDTTIATDSTPPSPSVDLSSFDTEA